MFIKRGIEFIKEEFPDLATWQDRYINEKAGKVKNSLELFGKIISIVDNSFKNLHIALLSGEFISNDSFLKDIDTLEESYNNLLLDYNGNSNTIHSLGDDLNKLILYPLGDIFDKLRHLNKSTEDKIQGVRKHSYLYKENRSVVPGTIFNIPIWPKIRLLNLNFELCRIDRNLRISKDVYQRLVLIITDLEGDFKNDVFQKPLIDKAKFLLKKIAFKLKDDDLAYEINFNKISAPNTIEPFDAWLKNIQEHYKEVGRQDFEFKREIEQLYSENIIREFEDYRSLLKHYKDDNKKEDHSLKFSRGRKLIEEFEVKFKPKYSSAESLKKRFDKRAFQVSLIYFYNNILSIAVKSDEVDDQHIEDLSNLILDYQHRNNIHNFFNFQKLGEYQSKLLDVEFSKTEKSFKTIERLIEKLENTINEAEKNYQWCINRDFMIFQMPFEKCKVPYVLEEELKFDMFLYSSFVLPLDYEFKHTGIYPLMENLRKFKLLLGFHKNIEREVQLIDHNKRSIEKSEKQNIEILSIFAAVVLFTFGEIKMFGNLSSKEFYQFTLLYAYSLVCFIILIWLITRDYSISNKWNKLPKMHYVIIGGFFIVTAMIFFKVFV